MIRVERKSNKMLNSGKLRGGRRQMLQLGDNETTALARKGKVMQVGSSSRSKPAGLSALGEYSDSDSDNSDTENHNGTSTHNGENDEAAITSSIVPENNVDNEVDSFLNEVNHLSASNSPAREGSSTPPTSTQSNQNKPKLKVSMYKSMFVKGATEWNRKEENKPVSESDCDINELPEEPITDWQICVDENTQYQYYWNTVSNEVTWTIPSDYTQYLLQYKLYEEQLAKIPEERREYLQKKKLGLIQSPKISKPKPSPPKQDRQETSTSNTPVTATNDPIGPSVNNGGDPPIKEELTDPEKQFYSEIEELEKMDVDPPEENPPMPDELPPLPPMPPPPEVETVKNNGDQSVTENSKPEIKGSDSEVNIDLEDIDNALEKALEKKKEELMKLEAEETDKPQQLNHHHNKHKRHSSPDSSIQTSQVAKKRKETVIVEEITRPTPPPSPPVEKPSKQSVDQVKKILVDYEHDESDDDQQGALRSKKNPVIDVDDISDLEEIKEVLESKLEFINTNKKSLTRLQILLIQLQTRYSDYLHGALKKEYFHQRLAKLQTELQEYEKSATPEGWTCQWDRNSRSYFYTEDVTGDTQWEHPDSAVQVVSESPHHHRHRHHHHSSQSKSRSSKSHSSKRSKDRRKEEKKSKSKSSRRSERDKEKDRDRSESPEVIHKSSRNHRKIDIESKIENISLGGLLSKNREAKTESITIEDDDDDEDVPAPPLSSNQPPLPSDPVIDNTEPVGASNAYNAATSDEDEVSVESHEPTVDNSTKADVVTPFGVIVRPPQYNSSEVSTSSMVDASTAVQSHATNSYAAAGPSTSSVVSSSTLFTSAPPPPPPPAQETNEVEGEPTVSSSEIKTEEPQASGSKEIRKKKKEKDMHNTNFSLKKKKVSSLVNKWKKVKIEVEKEEKIEDDRQLAIRQKLEEWKKDQP